MNEPSILFVKPGAITAADKKVLRAVGVIVVQIDDPQDAKFIRAGTELSGGTILSAALKALAGGSYASDMRETFVKAIAAAMAAEFPGRTS